MQLFFAENKFRIICDDGGETFDYSKAVCTIVGIVGMANAKAARSITVQPTLASGDEAKEAVAAAIQQLHPFCLCNMFPVRVALNQACISVTLDMLQLRRSYTEVVEKLAQAGALAFPPKSIRMVKWHIFWLTEACERAAEVAKLCGYDA